MMLRRLGVITGLLLLAGLAWGRPIDPSIDEGPGPFTYFSRPSTVLGVADGREGTQVTPEGWLYTGSAELVFFAGDDLRPLRQRVRTLDDNHLPIVNYSVLRDGIEYRVKMFGATLDGKPESNLINFIRITLRRPAGSGAEAKTATFSVAFRAVGPYCCRRMKRPVNLLRATYKLEGNYALRDDQVIYVFPLKPAPRKLIVPDKEGAGPITAAEGGVTERVPVAMVRYDVKLTPGQEVSLDFKMPYTPVPVSDADQLAALRKASFDDYLASTQKWWRNYLAEGMQIELPEPKPVNTFLTSIVYDSIARDKVGDRYIVKVNEFQYDAFWVRDGAYICAAFDVIGRPRWAEQGLEFFLTQQRADGIIYQPPQLDGWGQALWAFGEHWRLTGDNEWARRMYPHLMESVRGIFKKTHQDPLGLIPKAPPYDNEAIDGHYTGHSLWLLVGLRDVLAMAQAFGHEDDARQIKAWYDEYRDNFLRALAPVTAKTGGYVPPGLDAANGCDWGNLLLLYPRGGVPARGNFTPDDPRVAATVDTVRAKKYAEGVMTYGHGLKVGLLHHYLTMKVTENLVAMNRQRDTLEDFYSILAHTSATNAGFEFGIRPWDNRDPGGNFPPHGWFAAKYMALLRDMLVREWDGDLHLFTVLSPAWVKPGAVIAFRRAPTDFGELSARAKVLDNGLSLRLAAHWRTPPKSLVVHVPWFMEATAATADGKACRVQKVPVGEGQQIIVPPQARQVRIVWHQTANPDMSYARAVEQFKDEYRRRFQDFVAHGGKPEPLWSERELPLTQADRAARWEDLEARYGIAVGCRAEASSSEDGHPPLAAVDGSVNRDVYWGATPYPQWWQVDLGRERTVEAVRVVTYWDNARKGRSYQYHVLLSGDGKQWTTVADWSKNTKPATSQGVLHRFKPQRCRYVRVEMLHNSANPGVHLVEVMVLPAIEAPVVEAPANSQPAWTAEAQSGARATDFAGWGFVGAERIVLAGQYVKVGGDRICLQFRGGAKGSVEIADVSIGKTDPRDPRDLLANTRTPVTFGGLSRVELGPGQTVSSDWIRFHLEPGESYSVTFYVTRTGATTLWSDEKTKRYESRTSDAARKIRWSDLSPSETYNLYFLSAVLVPKK
ncbi:MAG: discoidin domain-containing protein [Armatimonadetes bacterium]|nr:discoidin domain-containing protein [Armatimonadota bacterium]